MIQTGNEGGVNMDLDAIDTSYWKLKDKAWVAERKAVWPEIEKMLVGRKSLKKSLTPIKDYFLRGKMPKWETYRTWEVFDGHLDLFCFLWLHPSWDKDVLIELRDVYLRSNLKVKRDLKQGYSFFKSASYIRSSGTISSELVGDPDWTDIPVTGHPELMFELMYGINGVYEFDEPIPRAGSKDKYEIPTLDWVVILFAGRWLNLPVLVKRHQEFILQYDLPLQHFLQRLKDVETYRAIEPSTIGNYNKFLRTLYRIQNIHQVERSEQQVACAQKLYRLFETEEYLPEIKAMWNGVKSGEIEVPEPWWPESQGAHPYDLKLREEKNRADGWV
jgi:hypothetical protein